MLKLILRFLLLLLIFSVASCSKNQKKVIKEGDDMRYWIVYNESLFINNTKHSIRLTSYSYPSLEMTNQLNIRPYDEYLTTYQTGRGDLIPIDAIELAYINVRFDDKYTITHHSYKNLDSNTVRDNQYYPDTDSLRSMFRENAYDIKYHGEDSSILYTFIYTFTEQDYLDAKERGKNPETQK